MPFACDITNTLTSSMLCSKDTFTFCVVLAFASYTLG